MKHGVHSQIAHKLALMMLSGCQSHCHVSSLSILLKPTQLFNAELNNQQF